MKKYINIIFVFIMLLFIPLNVNAENTCDASKVTVKSIEMIHKSNNVVESSSPEVDSNSLSMDIKMDEVNDFITYKIVINNNTNEDFKLNTKSITLNSNYLEYNLEFENDPVIKKNEDNVVLLKVKYNKEIPSSAFVNGMFNGDENASLYLANGRILNVPNTLSDNPLIMILIYIVSFVIIVGLTIVVLKHRDAKKYYVLIILPFILIPISAKADCMYTIDINTKMSVKEKVAIFDKGTNVNAKMKYLAGSSSSNTNYSISDANILHVVRSYDAPDISSMTEDNIVSSAESDIKIYAWFEEETGTLYYYTAYAKPFINKDAFDMFYELTKVKDIDVSTTNMYFTEILDDFVAYCNELEEIDLSYLGGDNIQRMYNIFYNDSSLKKINMSHFNFGKLATISSDSSIFYPLKNVLEEIDLSYIKMTNLTSARHAFYYYNKLKKIDVSYADMSNCNDFVHFISGNNLLEEIKVDHANFKSGISLQYMFSENPLIKKMTFDGVNLQSGQNFALFFKCCYALEEVNMSGLVANDDGLKTPNVTTFDELIIGCSSLKKLNLDGLGGPNLSIISYMIDSSDVLEEISMKNFNFGITGGSRILYHCANNAILDLTDADLSKAVGKDLFNGANHINKVIFKNAKMPKSMEGFFEESSVEEVVFDGADFSNTTSFKRMFYNAKKIKKVLFKDIAIGEDLTNMSYMFNNATSLEETDLSMFSVNNVTDISYMFAYTNSLKKVNVNGFEFDKEVTASCTFYMTGSNSDSLNISGVGNWKFNNKVTFYDFFFQIGNDNTELTIDKFDNFTITDSTSVLSYFFYGVRSSNVVDLGTLKVNSARTSYMFKNSKNIKLTINYYYAGNPDYYDMFNGAATGDGAKIIFNYDSSTPVETAQSIVNTKSDNSNVVLGNLVD